MHLLGKILPLMALISWSNMFGQNSSKTYYGINYSADVSYRNLNTSATDTIVQWIADSRDEWEKPILAYSGGITIEHQFKNSFTFNSGIQFYQVGESIKGSLSGISNNQENFKITYTYNYIGVPLQLGYRTPLSDKLDFTVGIGGSINAFLFTLNRSKIKDGEGEVVRNRSLSANGTNFTFERFNFMGTLSAGLDYKLY